MRIRCYHIRNGEDFVHTVMRMDSLFEQIGLKHFRNLNIYVTPVDQDGNEIELKADGELIKEIHISPQFYRFNKPPVFNDGQDNPEPSYIQSRQDKPVQKSNIPLNHSLH